MDNSCQFVWKPSIPHVWPLSTGVRPRLGPTRQRQLVGNVLKRHGRGSFPLDIEIERDDAGISQGELTRPASFEVWSIFFLLVFSVWVVS
jgi:hypothetical protein